MAEKSYTLMFKDPYFRAFCVLCIDEWIAKHNIFILNCHHICWVVDFPLIVIMYVANVNIIGQALLGLSDIY